jgi:hypothetical protein
MIGKSEGDRRQLQSELSRLRNVKSKNEMTVKRIRALELQLTLLNRKPLKILNRLRTA